MNRLASLSLALVMLTSCKPPAQEGSAVKDFAFDAKAAGANGKSANRAVLISFDTGDKGGGVQADLQNWQNMLAMGRLGSFLTKQLPANAKIADVQAAFDEIARDTSFGANSTLFVGYIGKRTGNLLHASDGTFKMSDVARGLVVPGKSFARAYFMIDAVGSGSSNETWVWEDQQKTFKQVLEMRASSRDVAAGASYADRFASIFSSQLAKEADEFEADKTRADNPKITAFLDAVKSKAKAEYRITEGQGVSKPFAGETMFNIDTFAKTGDGSIKEIALQLVRKDGSTTSLDKEAGAAKYIMIQFSTDWCGPCAEKAMALAENKDFNDALFGGNVKFFTLLTKDSTAKSGDAVKDWEKQLSSKRPSGGQAVTQATDRSFYLDRTGRQIGGLDENRQPVPGTELVSGTPMDAYSKFILVEVATKKIIAAGSAGSYDGVKEAALSKK